MIKAILFDVDGIIINREMYFSERYSRDFNVPLEKILPFYKNEFQKCLVGQADLKEELTKYLDDWEWNKPIEELLDYWFEHESTINKEVLSAVSDLRARGIKCYLATNNEKYRVDYLRQNLGLGQHFDGIFASCDLGAKKPSEAFWQSISEKIGFDNTEVEVLDDEPENVESANQYGFRSEIFSDIRSFLRKIQAQEEKDETIVSKVSLGGEA